MQFLDLGKSSRISRLLDLTRDLRDCRTPNDALTMYCRFLATSFPDCAQVILASRGLPQGQYRVWRLRTDDDVEHFDMENPWTSLEKMPVYSGGIIAKIIEEPIPRLVHHMECGDDPHFDFQLSPYHSLLAVPLFNEDLPLNWSIMFRREPAGLTVKDLEDSVARAALIGSLLGSLHLGRELSVAHTQIDAELRRMAHMQRALLPVPIPQIPGLGLAASYETFTHVGGDIYDFLPLHGGGTERWGMFIGDAAGHGPAAAVAAAMVQATLHACASRPNGPADLFQTINRHLCQKAIEGSFVTAFMGIYEPATRRLTYTSAGHPSPLLRSSSLHTPTALEESNGYPFGIERNAVYEQSTVQLLPGQTLFLYTDGISEARAPGGEMFGTNGIEQTLQNSHASAHGALHAMLRSVAKHQRGRRPDDDQTLVAVHIRSEGNPVE